MDVDDHRRAGAGAGDLFDAEGQGDMIHAGPAVLGRDQDSHQVELGGGLDRLGGIAVLAVDLGGDRFDHGFGEIAH